MDEEEITPQQLTELLSVIEYVQHARRHLTKAANSLMLGQSWIESQSFRGHKSGATCTTKAHDLRAEMLAMLSAMEPFLK